MEEQRSSKRVKVNIRVAYRDDGYAYKIGRVSNISRSGAFIVTETPPNDVNEYLTASLDVDDLGKIVWIQGRVIRKTKNGMGVVFTRTDAKGLDLYLSYLGVAF
ncbi:MAG TPA: PilZ domain-containing protein [Deltaproteobacteria bacterium]|jgi:hypothetical protein|nr:PilZ domain-containing protein [Deltaproteobacteria bacterium]HOI07737.1 PilZ domain-containing protein [Deltaproteobacteria bacterium]